MILTPRLGLRERLRRSPSGLVFWASVAAVVLLVSRWEPASAGPPRDSRETQKLEIRMVPDPAGPRGVPAGWQVQRYRGEPEPVLEEQGGRFRLRLASRGDMAWGIQKKINVDLREFPCLQWTWMATRLPRGGDVRHRETDDQALQLYVVFPGRGLNGRLSRTALAYVWENQAPKGLVTSSPQPSMKRVRYIVLRNRTDPLGARVTEKRDVLKDASALYRDLGLGEPPPAEGILLFINTHKTGSEAEGHIGDIFFSTR